MSFNRKMATCDAIGDGKRSIAIGPGLQIRDLVEKNTALKRENFNLKLRLTLIEDHLIESKVPEKQIKMMQQLTDAQVQVDILKRDIVDKQGLLREASGAINLLEKHLKDAEVQHEQTVDALKKRIECLELDRETDISHSAVPMDELKSQSGSKEKINTIQKIRELEGLNSLLQRELDVLQAVASVNNETLAEQKITMKNQEEQIKKLVVEKTELSELAENVDKHGQYRERFLQSLRNANNALAKEKQILQEALGVVQSDLRELMSVRPKEMTNKKIQAYQCQQDAECMCQLDDGGLPNNMVQVSQLEFTIGRLETTIGQLESTTGQLEAKIARLTYERNHILEFADNLEEQFITNENRLETYRSAYTNLRNEHINVIEELQKSRDKLRQRLLLSKKKTRDQKVQTFTEPVYHNNVPDAQRRTEVCTCTRENADDSKMHCECVPPKVDYKKDGRFFRSLINKLKSGREESSLAVNEGSVCTTQSRPLFESVTSGRRYPVEFQYRVKTNTCSCGNSCCSTYECTCQTSYISEQATTTTDEGHPRGGESSMCSCPCHCCSAVPDNSEQGCQYPLNGTNSSSSLYVSASSSSLMPNTDTSSTERHFGQGPSRYFYPVDGCIRENNTFERI